MPTTSGLIVIPDHNYAKSWDAEIWDSGDNSSLIDFDCRYPRSRYPRLCVLLPSSNGLLSQIIVAKNSGNLAVLVPIFHAWSLEIQSFGKSLSQISHMLTNAQSSHFTIWPHLTCWLTHFRYQSYVTVDASTINIMHVDVLQHRLSQPRYITCPVVAFLQQWPKAEHRGKSWERSMTSSRLMS